MASLHKVRKKGRKIEKRENKEGNTVRSDMWLPQRLAPRYDGWGSGGRAILSSVWKILHKHLTLIAGNDKLWLWGEYVQRMQRAGKSAFKWKCLPSMQEFDLRAANRFSQLVCWNAGTAAMTATKCARPLECSEARARICWGMITFLC